MIFTFDVTAGLELKLPGTNSCALGLSFRLLEIDGATALLLLAAVDLVVESASLIEDSFTITTLKLSIQ